MEKRRTLSTIIIFSLGFVVGVAVLILIGAIGSYIHPVTSLTWPKKFGDIKIWVDEPTDCENTSELDVSKMMFMAKRGIPFLTVGMNKSGKVAHFSLLGESERLILTMTASAEPGRWERLIYSGKDKNDRIGGEMFIDVNFDGHFDIRHIFDDTGKKVSRYIYIDQDWKKVDRCDVKKAIADTTTYVFDFNDGWR